MNTKSNAGDEINIGVDTGEKVDLIIDGFHLYSLSKSLGFEVDYSKLHELFAANCYLRRAHVFVAYVENDREEHNPVIPLTDWMEYHGFSVVRKALRDYVDPNSGSRQIKGDIKVEMTIQMLASASDADNIVLISGNADLAPAIAAVQAKGPRVTVISSMKADQRVSDELRRRADKFIELADIKSLFVRASQTRTIDARPKLVARQ